MVPAPESFRLRCHGVQYDIFILFWPKSAIWCQLFAVCDTTRMQYTNINVLNGT